jgi:PAS domain S-box-containing protein
MEDVLATHKQVEHTLRYLAAIAEQADEGVAVFDPAGVVLFVNPAWAGMHGYRTTNELVGRPISVFHTEPARQLAGGEQMQARPTSGGQADVIAFIEEAKRTGQTTGLVEHVKSDGTPFTAQVKMTVVKDEAGRATGLVAFATDITHRRQLEEMLRENTRRAAQLREQTARLQKLLAGCRDVEESLAKQAAELEADSQELRQRIAEWAQPQQMPRQCADAALRSTSPLSQQTCPTDGRREPKSAAPLAPPSREKTEHKQAKEVLRTGSERTPRSQARRYPLDTEELRKVAELGRRLASLS